MGKKYTNADWTDAKKRCRLNQADIQMAKELGMTPKSLTKNIPSKNQQWKAPVKQWVRDLYEEKFGTMIDNNHNNKNKPKKSTEPFDIESDDLPF
ncbi:hypothetical protein JCM21714_3761 [Gracilibacillus boraciitolerans JCM 21714]|uniref:Uncharacterized protein n=1 Tax=Gracilibacillus boraciitolerans JCM 21714 TaxID=1298598 RepID=W4VPB5_9BACI|nr:hypothetical protein [Gracilibacillus boraciitolerans]GAE94589.1 hypothetical protein JCM21714_3761 [Gracilibacillus boraciitolerans JCM 21714]